MSNQITAEQINDLLAQEDPEFRAFVERFPVQTWARQHRNREKTMTDRTHPDSGEILDPGIVPVLEAEIDRLRAELNALRKQEPVVWQKRLNIRDGEWETTQEHDAKWWRDNAKGWEIRALYASPVPSVPEAVWLPIQGKHPTFESVDLLCADGSILCNCVPQVDGDYWWGSPAGELFIDPKYAPVTHWRVAVQKPGEPT